jgi:hypothetical protein
VLQQGRAKAGRAGLFILSEKTLLLLCVLCVFTVQLKKINRPLRSRREER